MLISRRSFVLGAIAAVGSFRAARIPLAAPVTVQDTLYIHRSMHNVLAFNGYALADDMRDWTWRMYYAHQYTGDPDAALTAEALVHAKLDFHLHEVSDDDPLLQAELDELHMDNGRLSAQYDEWIFRTSSTARAHRFLEELLAKFPPDVRALLREELEITFEQGQRGLLVHIGEGKEELFAEITKRLDLPMRVVLAD